MEGTPQKLQIIYRALVAKYGHQGWWPISSLEIAGAKKGYHPQDYDYPKSEQQKFEICIGAILAQSTKWDGAKKALENLQGLKASDPASLLSLPEEKLKEAIRPAGYFNQKARKIRDFCTFYSTLQGRAPARDELLNIWGVGPETADSILLYAYKTPTFVIDAYTKRLLIRLGMASESSTYDEMKSLFEKNLEQKYEIYQEFHALIVEDGKRNSKQK